jgi:hypothetical protein
LVLVDYIRLTEDWSEKLPEPSCLLVYWWKGDLGLVSLRIIDRDGHKLLVETKDQQLGGNEMLTLEFNPLVDLDITQQIFH